MTRITHTSRTLVYSQDMLGRFVSHVLRLDSAVAENKVGIDRPGGWPPAHLPWDDSQLNCKAEAAHCYCDRASALSPGDSVHLYLPGEQS